MPTSTAIATDVNRELVRFLLSRADDDEREIKQLAKAEASDGSGVRALPRLRAELSAKRRLIGSLQQLVVLRDQPAERVVRHQAAQMLRVLALIYEDHGSYRAVWRPAGSR